MPELIRIEEGEKTFAAGRGQTTILSNITLGIERGETMSISGRSGSGKTTLLSILGGMERLTRGRYLFAGDDVVGMTASELARLRNRHIGFVFQHFHLIASYTALENVQIPLLYQGISLRESRKRALEALSSLGLEENARHKPRMLSGGQQQRVAIARAIVTRPEVILADEPTGALDELTEREVMSTLLGMNAQHGTTLVIVTHNPDIARQCARVIRLHDGQVTPDDT